MLSELDRPLYEEFLRQLQQLQMQVSPETVPATLQPGWQQVQQFFQQQILPLEFEGNSEEAYRLQSFKTETNKQLRLLGVDITFWQAARQPATRQQRQTQIHDRLTILMGYCEALLQGPSQES